jgi:gliding motility-associated-like protein
MTMTGIISINYINSTDSGDIIGAFVNGECRGVASPKLNTENNRYYADMVIYSNDFSATVNFKVYIAKNNTIINIDKGLNFEINKITGNTYKPYYWSSPTLSSDPGFKKFNIDGQKGETQISDSTIILNFPPDFLLNNVIAKFEVDTMTQVSIKGVSQISGETFNNFTDTLIYTVISADETTTKNYKVIAIAEHVLRLDATNTITPNGDGINDYWIIHNLEAFAGYELYIFTERGSPILSTTNYQNNWNGVYKGTTLPAGVYHYILRKDKITYSGSISLIR